MKEHVYSRNNLESDNLFGKIFLNFMFFKRLHSGPQADMILFCVGYNQIALRRSRHRIFSHIIPVLLTRTGICFSKYGSGRTGTGIFGRTGFQCKTGIPAGTRIHQMKFRPNQNCIKVKKLMNNTKVKSVQFVYDVR